MPHMAIFGQFADLRFMYHFGTRIGLNIYV